MPSTEYICCAMHQLSAPTKLLANFSFDLSSRPEPTTNGAACFHENTSVCPITSRDGEKPGSVGVYKKGRLSLYLTPKTANHHERRVRER